MNRPVRRRVPGATVLTVLSLLLLVACGSDSSDVPENRQFANDPVATRSATDEPTEEPTKVPTTAGTGGPDQATPETLLRTRGAPSTLYTLSGDRMVALGFSGGAAVELTVAIPDDVSILGYDASPTGDRVGVLMTLPDGNPVVQFFDASGTPVSDAFPILTESPGSSPVASPVASPVGMPANSTGATSVSWIPQGNGVLVVAGYAIIDVSVDDGPHAVDTDAVSGEIRHASVSPKGDQILLLVRAEDGSEGGWLLDRAKGNVHEVRALRTDPGKGISYLSWLPGGNGVIFVQGEVSGDVIIRGKLFRYLFRNEVPDLVATSGQGGPLSTITNVAISPGGHSVAYDVSVWDSGEWSAHSMWVRSLSKDVPGIQVPVNVGQPVAQIAWSNEGLFWVQERGGERSMRLMTPGGQVEEVQSGATPVASPVASPVTSASPVATPVD